MKTSELTGTLLNLAVARAIGKQVTVGKSLVGRNLIVRDRAGWPYDPSTRWDHGGPLLNSGAMLVGPSPYIQGWSLAGEGSDWESAKNVCSGNTPLVAIARSIVTKHFGVEIDIPTEVVFDLKLEVETC